MKSIKKFRPKCRAAVPKDWPSRYLRSCPVFCLPSGSSPPLSADGRHTAPFVWPAPIRFPFTLLHSQNQYFSFIYFQFLAFIFPISGFRLSARLRSAESLRRRLCRRVNTLLERSRFLHLISSIWESLHSVHR